MTFSPSVWKFCKNTYKPRRKTFIYSLTCVIPGGLLRHLWAESGRDEKDLFLMARVRKGESSCPGGSWRCCRADWRSVCLSLVPAVFPHKLFASLPGLVKDELAVHCPVLEALTLRSSCSSSPRHPGFRRQRGESGEQLCVQLQSESEVFPCSSPLIEQEE